MVSRRGGLQPLNALASPRCASTSAPSSSRSPPVCTATVSTTGQPSSAASRAGSTFMPRLRAMSLRLSATRIGTTQALQLQRQAQPQAQVGGIDHVDDEVGGFLAVQPADHHIARDGLVQRRGRKAVGAGQIEHAIGSRTRCVMAHAFLALDGHARIVGHVLVAAGQSIEQRGLAAVGHAHQRDAQRILPRGFLEYCVHGVRRHDHDRRSLASTQRKAAATDAHGDGISTGPRLGNDLEGLTRRRIRSRSAA